MKPMGRARAKGDVQTSCLQECIYVTLGKGKKSFCLTFLHISKVYNSVWWDGLWEETVWGRREIGTDVCRVA